MILYTYVPEMADRRQPHRADHLEHLKRARDEGKLSLGAAFNDPVDGALLLLDANDPGQVLAWVATDPYARAGLLRGVTVRELTVAFR